MVCGHSSKQLTAKCLVERAARDGEGQRLYHVLHEMEVTHVLEDGCKLHEDFLWLDAVAQAIDDLIDLLLVELFLVHVDALDHNSHYVSEIRFILHRKHTNQLYLQFDKIAVLKVDIVDYFYVNVLVLVNELRIKVPKEHNVPVHDDLTRICLVLLFVWQRLRPRRLVSFELISQLVEDVVEVVFVFHDVENQLQKLVIDFLHESLQRLPLDVDEDDLNDVWELLLIHFFHELFLISFYLQFILG